MTRITRTVAILGIAVPVFAGAERGGMGLEDYRCNYQARYSCTKSGCTPVLRELAAQYLLVPPLRVLEQAGSREHNVEIRLCDEKGCSPVAMHASSAGAFLDLTQANRGTQYMKIFTSSANMPAFGRVPSLSRGDFSDVVDELLVTIVGYGHCEWPSK
jgi:hypothetical protein